MRPDGGGGSPAGWAEADMTGCGGGGGDGFGGGGAGAGIGAGAGVACGGSSGEVVGANGLAGPGVEMRFRWEVP